MSGPRGVVVSIGDELVSGLHLDLNAPRLARGLLELGVPIERFLSLPDDPKAVAEALREEGARADFLVASGGLGPTLDDVTRDAAAAAGGVPLELDPGQLAAIEARFARRGLPTPESNRRQALFPKGSAVLANPWGTAPGFRMRIGRALAFFLPGPPREMEAMLEAAVLPAIREALPARPGAFVRRRLHAFGVMEAILGERIADWMAGENPRVGTTVRKGEITVSILARGGDEGSARALAERAAEDIRGRLVEAVFGEEGTTLAGAVGRLLIERGISCATAESCTGGLLAKALTDTPGISAVYREGLVVYSNEAKVARLGVPPGTLERFGAVSRETALAMAEGVARTAGVRLGLSVTGIAGPAGGSPEKPVGLVFLGVCLDGCARAWRRQYPPSDRRLIRELAAREALNLARLLLLGRAREE
ncbi:MAG TPA: CinA family nicotinamide mononucleotide deamidase-related protein [Planctomycetota bacterium]|nr:CinA family nicotinamide mononucleotide deamidase-related protein [Planctomycetota bacterium]